MSEDWAEHKPDEKENASSQENDFTGDVELDKVFVDDPV